MTGCPFCSLPASRIVDETEHCLTIRDAFPVSEGHTLVISKRHVGSLFDLSESEVQDLFGACFDIEQVYSEDCLEREPRFRQKGLTRMFERVHILRRHG